MARTVRHFSVIVGPVFDAGSGQVRFVVYKVALGQFFLSEFCGFSSSVSFLQCSILTSFFILVLLEGQTGET
jgi:hypothetical protein